MMNLHCDMEQKPSAVFTLSMSRLQVTAPKEVTEMIYTDTVAVLPAYARAVAADLRASSERWHQYQEPPSYFDDALGGLTLQMSPAAREAYQDESVLGRALQVS